MLDMGPIVRGATWAGGAGLVAGGRDTGPRVRLESFELVAQEWEALFRADSEATPYSSPQWAAASLAHWSAGKRSYILAVRDGSRLVGLAPFVLERRGSARLLRGLGVGVGSYWDVIAEDDRREEVTRAIMAALRERTAEWDVLVLDRLAPDTLTERLVGDSFTVIHRRPTVSPGLVLPDSFDEYLASLPSLRRSKVRRYLRPLDRGEIELVSIEDPARLSESVVTWQRLRAASWTDRGRQVNSEHASQRFQSFTIEALTTMVPAGLAVVWELRHQGEAIAVSINLVDEGTFYGWLAAFDARYQRLQLGHVVIAHGIQSSIEAGRDYFDFMVGDEPYKYEYRPTDRLMPWLLVGHGGLRSRAACAAASRLRSRHERARARSKSQNPGFRFHSAGRAGG
jgi:CelD/BcsL family acetyltransferase involved in cellulose biosynthesis